MKRFAPVLLFLFSLGSCFSAGSLHAQTPGLYINEVSQGPSGAKEWVELLVVGTPTCYTIPTMDLRGWYIDDNNGNHATGSGTGIAQGCVRFTNDPLWSAVPIGTIILIYNDADRDPALPATDDLSLSDGNCRLVIPISNCSLFEKHTTLPSTASATYPTTGFTPCGSWTNVSMANGDDSYQTISPAGTLFHSVSWGNNTLNQIIYFAGPATGNVAYMTNSTSNNISLQANWVMVGTAASTPGAANNAANLAWICKMNNGCTAPTPISLSSTFVNASCTCTGSATVAASGGFNGCGGSYTYSWAPSGGNAATASALCAGTYTVTVSDVNGCSSTSSVTITAATSFTLSTTQTNVTCNGGTNGSATVSVSGGTGPFTYAWSPSGGTGATASGLGAGTYTVTVTDATSCSGTATVTITQPAVLSATQSHTNVTCNGASTGTAAVTPSGGTPNYTYSWAPSGGTGSSANALAAGTYTCTITDANGCAITQTVTITQPAALSAMASSTAATCGGNNGTATASVSGGTGTYSYSWTPSGGNTATASGLVAGTYTCTITDANGCTTTAVTTVTSTGGVTASVSAPVNVSCFGGNNGSATTTVAGGTGPFSYAWTPSGGSAATGTGFSAGTYTVTVTDANGCIAAASVTITEPSALATSETHTNVSCNAGANATASITASGGTPNYTYSWAPSGGTGSTASALTAGTYTCTITDANGCTTTQSVTITQPAALSVTASQVNELCNGGTNGSATITPSGGSPSYSYSWAPSGGTGSSATSLAAGTYTCTVTDANGCTITQSVTITEPAALTVTASTNAATCNAGNGSATVTPAGGTGTYTYAWSPVGGNAATASNLPAGSYSCTVTDANGCTATAGATVLNTGAATLSLSATTNVSCFGGNDGSSTVTATGGTAPYTYAWSPSGGNTATGTNLSAGTFTVDVTDANGCITSQTVAITEPPALTISANSSPVDCFGNASGSASVTTTGGTGAYSYSWSPAGGSSATTANLAAQNYTCTVTDANGCIITQSVSITEPPQLTLSAAGFNVSCFNACDGQVAVIPSGGSPNYTFAWNTGCTNASCSNSCAGSYSVTVTDANGCTATDSATVTEPPAIVITTSSTDAYCNQANGSATANASGGTGNLAYQWNGGPASQNYTTISAGNYSVVVTDQNGCSDSAIVTVNNISGVNASAGNVTNLSCFNSNNGTAVVNASGGNGPYSYNWQPNVSVTDSVSGIPAGNYQVTVVDADGCSSTVTLTVTQPQALILAAAATDSSLCTGQGTQLAAAANGGTPGYTYTWNPGALNGNLQNISPAATTTYTAYVTDTNGCSDSTAITISVDPVPVPLFTADTVSGCAPLCVNFSDASTGPVSYWNWDFGDGNVSSAQDPSHCYANPGNYTVTLNTATAAGCTGTIVMNNFISVFAIPSAAFVCSPQPATMINPEITFTDGSSGAVTWNWSFGDLQNSYSSLQNPVFQYPDATCYSVVLTVTSANGCSDTAMQEVCIDPEITLYVPNTFTPNGDGSNEYFLPLGTGIEWNTFHMLIYDRWGNLIYETYSISEPWDGRVQGHSEIVQEDVYVWKISVTDIKGGKHNLIGHVNVIK